MPGAHAPYYLRSTPIGKKFVTIAYTRKLPPSNHHPKRHDIKNQKLSVYLESRIVFNRYTERTHDKCHARECVANDGRYVRVRARVCHTLSLLPVPLSDHHTVRSSYIDLPEFVCRALCRLVLVTEKIIVLFPLITRVGSSKNEKPGEIHGRAREKKSRGEKLRGKKVVR